MKTCEIPHPLFRAAVEAMDSGDVRALERLLNRNRGLTAERLDTPPDGYFKNPYLLWFVADNPIRHESLPPQTADITRVLVSAVQRDAPESFQYQIDYTLGLVTTGRIPRESGVQLEMMDVLIDAGAVPGPGHGALANGNKAAAAHLLERGGKLTLATAVCLRRMDDVHRLVKTAHSSELATALTAAAFYGMPEMLHYLLAAGAEVNARPGSASGFHSHATALHQAVSSGSPESVEVLVMAGADLNLTDQVYRGTPLGWAKLMRDEAADETEGRQYDRIISLLVPH